MFVKIFIENADLNGDGGEFVFVLRRYGAHVFCVEDEIRASYRGSITSCIDLANYALEFDFVELEIKNGGDYGGKEKVRQGSGREASHSLPG